MSEEDKAEPEDVAVKPDLNVEVRHYCVLHHACMYSLLAFMAVYFIKTRAYVGHISCQKFKSFSSHFSSPENGEKDKITK